MFEDQYNEEMEKEVKRLEARKRAVEAGHPEWVNACTLCGVRLDTTDSDRCGKCSSAVQLTAPHQG